MENNLGELFAALAKAQMEMINAEKNNENVAQRYKYADLVTIVEAARPYLSKNGLAIIQRVFMENDEMYLQTILGHSSGQSIDSTIKVVVKDTFVDKEGKEKKSNWMQALGSSLTYLRKYSYACLVNVAAGSNDDDGVESMPPNYNPIKTPPPPTKPVPVISNEEAAIINGIIGDNEDLFNELLKKAGITALGQLPKSKYNSAVLWLEEYGKKQ